MMLLYHIPLYHLLWTNVLNAQEYWANL